MCVRLILFGCPEVLPSCEKSAQLSGMSEKLFSVDHISQLSPFKISVEKLLFTPTSSGLIFGILIHLPLSMHSVPLSYKEISYRR